MAKKLKEIPKKLAEKAAEHIPNLPPAAIYCFFAFWLYVVWKNYFERSPVNFGMLDYILSLREFGQKVILSTWVSHVTSFALVALIYAGAYGVGERLRKLMSINGDTARENAVFSLGLGFTAVIFLTFALGALGLFYKALFLVVFILLGGYGIIELRAGYRNLKASAAQQGKKEPFSVINVLLVGVLLLAGVITLITALTPETFYDSMQYHLGVPLIWAQNHRICRIPTIMQSYYQMNIHLLYVVGLLLKDDSLTKLLNWSFGILATGVVYVFAKKYFSRAAAILSCAVFLSIPLVMFVASRSCIELPIAFFETLAVLAVVNWLETKNDRWLYLTAIFSGVAIGSKHTSAVCVISLTAALFVYFALYRRPEFPGLWKRVFIFLLINLALFSPWLIKDLILTGNPIYPFILDLKTGVRQVAKGVVGGYIDQTPLPLSVRNIVTVPWRVTMGEFQEGYSGAVILFLLPLLFFFRKVKTPARFCLIYMTFYYLLWVKLGGGYLRLFTPALPVIALVISHYASDTKLSGIFNNLVKFAVVLFCCANLFLIMSSQKICQNPLGYVLGLQSKYEYLTTQRQTYPCPAYCAIDWANRNLPEDSVIAFFGETRPYYSQRKVITCSAGDFNQVILWCKEARSAQELRDILAREKVTHFLLNVPEARRLLGYDIFQFEASDLRIFAAFWNKYVKQVYSALNDVTLNNGMRGSLVPQFWEGYSKSPFSYVYVYEIMPEEEANRPHQAPYDFFLNKDMYPSGPNSRYEKIKEVIENR